MNKVTVIHRSRYTEIVGSLWEGGSGHVYMLTYHDNKYYMVDLVSGNMYCKGKSYEPTTDTYTRAKEVKIEGLI